MGILFQDFGSFSLSLFRILYQVDSLSLPLLFGLVGIYPVLYLLGIPLSLHLVYIAEFGVAFLYSGNLWSSLYYEVFLLWVGLYQWLVKVSWLGKLVPMFWWAFILFLYLLGIPLSLHLYIADFGVSFLYSGSLWSSLYYGVS